MGKNRLIHYLLISIFAAMISTSMFDRNQAWSWDVDQSDYAILIYYGAPINYVYEPENNTLSYGVTVGFGF